MLGELFALWCNYDQKQCLFLSPKLFTPSFIKKNFTSGDKNNLVKLN